MIQLNSCHDFFLRRFYDWLETKNMLNCHPESLRIGLMNGN